ncbi:hypothetical protein ASE00_05225 [Sphingomonas sp. Root710]|nr:hypothetical protein ASE00_05225 [Sphingomonas sp. Root710]
MSIGIASQASAQAAATAESNEEIIVTASRRAESIRETPTAVSAYLGKRLQEAQISSLSELVTTSPNIQISTYGSNSNIAIRGIGNTQLVAGADPGVALHVDGVYLAQSSLATATFLDVNRVEILRGPQGTLFGRNATGGAINIIPNRPTAALSAGLDVSGGIDPGLIRSSAYISGPLDEAGSLRARLAVQQKYGRGFTKNLVANGPDRLDGEKTYSGRAQLEWLASDRFTARVSLEYQKEDDNGQGFFFFGTPDPSIPLPAAIQSAATGDPKKRETYANQGKRELESKSIRTEGELQLGGGSLRAVYSFMRSSIFQNLDGDATPVNFTNTMFDQSADQNYAELLYASDSSKPLSVVLGANLFSEDFTQDLAVPISFLPIPVLIAAEIKTRSYALFAHGQYAFSPSARLFAGLRYSNDRKRIQESNSFIGAGGQRAKWDRVTYEAGASADLAERVTGYVKYATGYKGGGFSAGGLAPSFNPETNSSIELGLKGTYLDGMLDANLAAFHMKYKNLQVSQVIGVVSSVVNAARATIDGLELEMTLRPMANLRLEFAGAWLHARFDEFFTQDSARPSFTPDCETRGGVPVCGIQLAGNRLPQAPRFSASPAIYYDLPLKGGAITLGARYDWKSRFYFTEFNIPVTAQKAAGTLDLSIAYKSEDARWSASLFARNVTDETIKAQAYVNSALLGSLALGQLQPGRQIGASFGYRF